MTAPSSARSLRIVFVLNALSTGGAEIHSVGLARALADDGHTCLLMPLLPLRQIDVQGLDVRLVGGSKFADFAAHRRMAASLNDFAPDVIVAVNGRPAAYAQLARLIGGARRRPVITVYHTTRLPDLREKLKFAYNLPFVNMSERLIYVSENQRAYCTRQGMRGQHVLTIHNGIDIGRFNPGARDEHRAAMRARLGIAAHELVIGQSAAFRPEKNHAQSIAAMSALCRQGIPARLLLVGDGRERLQIEARVAEAGLGDAVVWAGRQADVVPWLSAFDVGILTSTAIETFSLAALEFMALGVPAVISEIGGASEMVSDGENGYLFPARDTKALVSALVRMSDDATRERMGAAAAARVRESFQIDDMVARYAGVLKEFAA